MSLAKTSHGTVHGSDDDLKAQFDSDFEDAQTDIGTDHPVNRAGATTSHTCDPIGCWSGRVD